MPHLPRYPIVGMRGYVAGTSRILACAAYRPFTDGLSRRGVLFRDHSQQLLTIRFEVKRFVLYHCPQTPSRLFSGRAAVDVHQSNCSDCHSRSPKRFPSSSPFLKRLQPPRPLLHRTHSSPLRFFPATPPCWSSTSNLHNFL